MVSQKDLREIRKWYPKCGPFCFNLTGEDVYLIFEDDSNVLHRIVVRHQILNRLLKEVNKLRRYRN